MQRKLAAMHPKERLSTLLRVLGVPTDLEFFFVTREIPIWGLVCILVISGHSGRCPEKRGSKECCLYDDVRWEVGDGGR